MRYGSIDIETLGLDPKSCDTIEFACVLDKLKSNPDPIEELPTFHCYLTRPRNIYKGEVYAMYMHSKSKIFERIAKREPGYSYVPFDLLDEVFADWLKEQGYGDKDKLVVAGKNFAAFDLQFLKEIGFGVQTRLHHRTLDPGSMYFDPFKDDVPPSLEECLKRGPGESEVEHTATEDAQDVIRCIRAKYFDNGFERKEPPF